MPPVRISSPAVPTRLSGSSRLPGAKSASLSATLSFLSLSLTPLAVRFLSGGEDVTFALGLLTLLLLGVTAIGARRMSASIVQNIRLRLQSAAQLAALRGVSQPGAAGSQS